MKKLSVILALGVMAVPALAGDGSALVNRISWGETADGATLGGLSPHAWLEQQLRASENDGLPPQVQAEIDALQISHMPMTEIAAQVRELQLQARAAKKEEKTADANLASQKDVAQDAMKNGKPADDTQVQEARKPYRQMLISLALQAQTRSLLRDVYSKNQLKEQLTWFWLNHFNVYAKKGEIAALVGDYEESAIRPHVLGKFRDLLSATVFHPAMIQYLDNQQNAADKINENYAREIMELHTMGVGGGYSQKDVQELARILTGVGVNLTGRPRAFRALARPDYRSDGLFEFIPKRHDFGDKIFLGQTIKGEGLAEVSTAIDILARQPATARFISTQLAQYFCCDAPSPTLIGAMTATWASSDGDIAAVLRTLFNSGEFTASLGHKFKDPIHYAVSAVRAFYGNQPIVNPLPITIWTIRMGEPLYGHETPDGYPLTEAAWAGPGQMASRFEIAKTIGAGAPQLFRAEGGDMSLRPPPPVLEQTAYYQTLQLPQTTRAAITQGATPADRNMLLLSSPEFMRR